MKSDRSRLLSDLSAKVPVGGTCWIKEACEVAGQTRYSRYFNQGNGQVIQFHEIFTAEEMQQHRKYVAARLWWMNKHFWRSVKAGNYCGFE